MLRERREDVKIDRLFGILSVLLEQDRVKTKDLARRFEVSERTIDRDIATIERAGMPIVTYPGAGGGVGLLEGYKLDKRLLSRQDLAVIIAGLSGLGTIDGDSGNLQALLAKLSPQAASSLALESDIVIDFSSWDNDVVLPRKISRLREAIANRQCVKLRYISGSGWSERQVEPCKIVFKARGWYLYGYCRLREEFRLFKLNRIAEMELQEHFVPRPLGELDLRWEDPPPDEGRAVLRFSSSQEHLVMDLFGPENYHHLPDGRVEAVMENTCEQWVIGLVLGLGGGVELVQPKAWRNRLAERLKKNWEQHNTEH